MMEPLSVAPLAASVRMGDNDYPGVVAQFGPDFRLSVSMDGRRYAMQQRVDDGGVPGWMPAGGGRSPQTLAKIVAKYGDQVPGLASVCEGLPDDPALAVPDLAARRQAQLAALPLRAVTHDDYLRAVAFDKQMRVAVDPDGLFYVLQWKGVGDLGDPSVRWKNLHSAPDLSDLRDFVLGAVYQPEDGGRVLGDDLLPRWLLFVGHLPERAEDGDWPALPLSE